MEQDKFQELVLEHLLALRERMGSLEQRQEKLEQGQVKLEQGQKKLEEGQIDLSIGQTALCGRMDQVEQSIQEMKLQQINMEQSLSEKISALFDAREEQFDINERIFVSLDRIEMKFDRLLFRTVKQATEISDLKRAK